MICIVWPSRPIVDPPPLFRSSLSRSIVPVHRSLFRPPFQCDFSDGSLTDMFFIDPSLWLSFDGPSYHYFRSGWLARWLARWRARWRAASVCFSFPYPSGWVAFPHLITASLHCPRFFAPFLLLCFALLSFCQVCLPD